MPTAAPAKTEKPDPAADEHKPGGLFDASHYDDPELAIPKVDGQGIDKIRVAFTGSVMLDRSDPRDVALFRKLKLGKEVELRVAGKIAKTATGWTTNREGDLDAVVGERTCKIDTVWVLDPENLAGVARTSDDEEDGEPEQEREAA